MKARFVFCLTEEIETPDAQLEPQITSLELWLRLTKMKLETPIYSMFGVGVGGSYSIGDCPSPLGGTVRSPRPGWSSGLPWLRTNGVKH